MAGRIKGITVEINGDTTKLSKALEGVNKNIKNTQTQLKDVEKLLKLDPTNTELLSQKHKLLADAVKDTKEKLETLKAAAEQQAEVVRKVFTLYEHGESIDKISKYLQRHLIPTPECGKEWSVGTVRKMLMNERYCGDILLQKTICESHITHKQIKNDMTEVPSYYIEDHHPAIISRKQFQRCKEIFEMRRTPHPDMPGTYNNQYPLGDKLICPNCGSRLFKRSMKIQEPGSGWSCEVGEYACRQFIIREYIVDKALLNAYNTLDVGLVENKLDSPKFGTAAETMLEFKREYPEMKKVGYWWVDDLIDHIEFGKHSRKTKELIALEVKGTPDTADRTMKVYWKCGLVTTVPSCVEYDKELPSRVAELYHNQQKRIADRNKRKGRPKK